MKRILSLFIVALLSIQVYAQRTAGEKAVSPGLLWEISGNGLKQPSYLYGTYHFMGKSFLDTLPEVTKALASAKLVVGEVVMDDEMVMAQKMMPYMLLKDNSLDKIYSPEEYAELDAFVKTKMSAGLAVFNGMKPAAVQVMLLAFMIPKDISPENPGLDSYFQKEAKRLGKEVSGFETGESQAEMLLNSSLDKQKKTLLKTVRENERMAKESQNLFTAYKAGNLPEIEKALAESDDFTAEDIELFLTNRNKNWLKAMPALLAKGNVFFAVGVGHLPGKDGLITLLKNAGYTVRPVALK